MSQYGIIYRMEFLNAEGFTVRVNISPTDVLIGDGDTPQIIELKGGDSPVIISASNNDEDKFTPIRSKSARIKFRTDTASGLDSSTFSQGGDNLWVCDIILQDTPAYIFRGFLMMADNQQPFQPDPQYVTLTATDHLGALKEVALTDLSGDVPQGKYRVADLINFCLRKTGLSLSFFVVNNLRAGSGQLTNPLTFSQPGNYFVTDSLLTKYFYPGQEITISGTVSNNGTFIVASVDNSGLVSQVTLTTTITVSEGASGGVINDTQSLLHWYDAVYIDAKTFEAEIGTCENCYSVLEKILGEDCFITQWLGNWWIFRVDEMEDNPVYVAEFDNTGAYISTAAGTQYDKSIGRTEDHKFANADALLRFVRPHDHIKETFNFDTPLEVPCNVDFSRGTIFSDTQPLKKYTPECWTLRRGYPTSPQATTITPYIQKNFNLNDYETDRFMVVPNAASPTYLEYLESEPIPISVNDKIEVAFDWRLTTATGFATQFIKYLSVVLHGDDGTWWLLGGIGTSDDPSYVPGSSQFKWYNTSSFGANTAAPDIFYDFNDIDETEWQSFTWSAPPAPIGGNIYLWLNNWKQSGSSNYNRVIEYGNLSVTYSPIINGTYQKYAGQSSRIDRTEDGYLANRDKTVSISDSPVKLFKGSMFLYVNSVYILFPNWFNAATLGNTVVVPSQDYLHPYGYIQAFSVWNQYKGYNTSSPVRGIGINIFSGSVKGLTDDWPDLLHRYNLTDTNLQTINRYFILTSLEQNWKTCIWTATLIEVYNRVIFKSYSDPFEFKYISR